jgi:hypothetical protein
MDVHEMQNLNVAKLHVCLNSKIKIEKVTSYVIYNPDLTNYSYRNLTQTLTYKMKADTAYSVVLQI